MKASFDTKFAFADEDMKALNEQQLEVTVTLMRQITEKQDALIREAITKALGTDDWSLDDMRGRIEGVTYSDGVTRWRFDGREILEIHPPTHGPYDNGKITTVFNYRMLA